MATLLNEDNLGLINPAPFQWAINVSRLQYIPTSERAAQRKAKWEKVVSNQIIPYLG